MDIILFNLQREIVLLCSYKLKSMDDNSLDINKSADDWEEKKHWFEFNIQPRFKNIIDYFADYHLIYDKK